MTGRSTNNHPILRRRIRSVLGMLICCIGLASLALAIGVARPEALGPGEQACHKQAAVNATMAVQADGAVLHVLLRGRDCAAPILLWLHGGPGGAETPLFRLYDSALERHFIVAYLDQRGAGLSYDPAADTARLTVAQHLADLDSVISVLEQKLSGQKVVLIGHSWGAALGLLYAHDHPAKVARVIAVNPLISAVDAQREQYAFAVLQARTQHDAGALQRLSLIGQPPWSGRQELKVQAIVDRYGGVFHRRPNRWEVVLEATLRGLVNPFEIPRYIRANDVSLTTMTPELLRLDLRRVIHRLDVPLDLMLGRFDHQIDNSAALGFADAVNSPSKRVLWFEQSAHNIPFEEPANFVRRVAEIVE